MAPCHAGCGVVAGSGARGWEILALSRSARHVLTRRRSCNICSGMRRDSRLSVALHVLLHMSEMDDVVTSETLALMMGMNPVVLRRTLSGLREAGIVGSEKGHGGGWSLARDLRTVTLGDVFDALGTTTLFGIAPRDENAACLIERAVNRAVGDVLAEAEQLLAARLRSIPVADILVGARRKLTACSRKGSKAHA